VSVEVENGATVLAIGYGRTRSFCWKGSVIYLSGLIGARSFT